MLFNDSNFPITPASLSKFKGITFQAIDTLSDVGKESNITKTNIFKLVISSLSLAFYIIHIRRHDVLSDSTDFIRFAICVLNHYDKSISDNSDISNTHYQTQINICLGRDNGGDEGRKRGGVHKEVKCILKEEHMPFISPRLPYIDLLFLILLSTYKISDKNPYSLTDNEFTTRRFSNKRNCLSERNYFQQEFCNLGGIFTLLPYVQKGLQEFEKILSTIVIIWDKSNECGGRAGDKNNEAHNTQQRMNSFSLLRMNMALKLLENLSYSSADNQKCMSETSALMQILMKTILFGCNLLSNRNYLSASKCQEIVEICIENASRVLINITNGNMASANTISKIQIPNFDKKSIKKSFTGMEVLTYLLEVASSGYRLNNFNTPSKMELHEIVDYKKENSDVSSATIEGIELVSHFDIALLALALLGNCLEHHNKNCQDFRNMFVKEVSITKYLISLFVKCQLNETKRNENLENNGLTDSKWDPEALSIAGHISLIIGCIVKNETSYLNVVLEQLPNKSLTPLLTALNMFAKFQSDCGVLTMSMAQSISSVQNLFLFLKSEGGGGRNADCSSIPNQKTKLK